MVAKVDMVSPSLLPVKPLVKVPRTHTHTPPSHESSKVRPEFRVWSPATCKNTELCWNTEITVQEVFVKTGWVSSGARKNGE